MHFSMGACWASWSLLLETGKAELGCYKEAGAGFDPLFGLYDAVAIEVGREVAVTKDLTARVVGLEATDQGAEGVLLLEGAGVGGVAVAV